MYQEALKVSLEEKLRLSETPIGVIFNFAPMKDQCERYYYDAKAKTVTAF